jgi:hypothetical protein
MGLLRLRLFPAWKWATIAILFLIKVFSGFLQCSQFHANDVRLTCAVTVGLVGFVSGRL